MWPDRVSNPGPPTYESGIFEYVRSNNSAINDPVTVFLRL